MDTLEGLEKLARRASQEEKPFFSVAETVRLRIISESANSGRSFSLIPLGLLGGFSAIAASIVISLTIQWWQYMSSPIMELLSPLPEIPLW